MQYLGCKQNGQGSSQKSKIRIIPPASISRLIEAIWTMWQWAKPDDLLRFHQSKSVHIDRLIGFAIGTVIVSLAK